MDESTDVIRFEEGKHYLEDRNATGCKTPCVCLKRIGKKTIYVNLIYHNPGTQLPEYYPRGKSGITVDWHKVHIVDGVECAHKEWGIWWWRANRCVEDGTAVDVKPTPAHTPRQEVVAIHNKEEQPNQTEQEKPKRSAIGRIFSFIFGS